MLVFALMTFVFVLGFLVLPNYDLVDQLKNRQASYPAAAYAVQNPALSHEINALKSQLVGLVSGSIESKLRILEESIKIGSLSASLGTIQDLKNDVKVLRSYSEPPIKEREQQVNEKLIAELSHLKNLIYLTFASCGLMIAAIAGFWLRNRFRLPHQRVKSYIGRK
ncbi:hypothetical protein Q9L42_016045 [Methylomarinum sp. Ch1-1]|uniref:Methyl-accepting chemotaxis protein n=1 Tax=Methylomarinum roseum TaxID=3067653 RepID=A0AAU7NS91_9GAMM|nr:hypothetical protein [Methylomarinum sp. Ch1-1]MDP4520148.1 hypothetical protein [Methylomarinum sp. Ch1-1]